MATTSRPGRSGSNLVAAGIFLSRIAGLVRNAVLNTVFRDGTAALDAVNFAMRLPNLLQNLLGEGSLSASFIPVYAKLVEEAEEEGGEEGDTRRADDLAGAVVAILAAATAVIVALLLLLARPLVWLLTPWENDPELYDLFTNLTRITTIGIGFLVISAWCLGILNSHRSFFTSYVAPVIWNVTQIAAMVAFVLLGWATDDIAVGLAWAVVLGGLLQLLVQLPRVRRVAPLVRPNLRRTAEVDDVIGRFLPAVGARGVVQISSWTDLAIAGLLTVGALSWYTLALPLYLLPISLFGFSVAAAELAEMSRTADDREAVAARLRPALRQVIIPAGYITAAYLAIGPSIVDAVYGWFSRIFTDGVRADTLAVIGLVVTAFAVGLPATMTARVTQNTLYSLGDVKGPARIAVVRLVVSVVAALILTLQFDWLTFTDDVAANVDTFPAAGTQIVAFADVPHWPPWERVPLERRLDDEAPAHLGAVGLALGASVASWVEWALLRRLLKRRLGGPIRSGLLRPVVMAGVAAAVVMAAARWTLAEPLGLPSPLDAGPAALLGIAAYGGTLLTQGVRPTFWRSGG